MDKKKITVIICCAGMGTRLGIGTTKALVNINGKPLILHQLELLDQYDDIRIVLGYQAERVISVVTKYRNDIMFAFNYDYKNTGAAASLSKALPGAREYVVSMDGDLVVHPQNFKEFLDYNGECIAVSDCNSDEPVHIDVENSKAVRFSKNGKYEWPGLVKIQSGRLTPHSGHTYEMLNTVLPIDVLHVQTRDIDTPDDYDRAVAWVEAGYERTGGKNE